MLPTNSLLQLDPTSCLVGAVSLLLGCDSFSIIPETFGETLEWLKWNHTLLRLDIALVSHAGAGNEHALPSPPPPLADPGGFTFHRWENRA
jgi:hypothetical protein